jgi:conjugative transfer region protein TrbK
MCCRLLKLTAIVPAAGFVLVTIVIATATLHFRNTPSPIEKRSAEPEAVSDPLTDGRKQCQLAATQAKDTATCEAFWAENRRRFFTYRSSPEAATTSDAPSKYSGG